MNKFSQTESKNVFDLESEEGLKMLHLLNPCKSILRQYYAKSCNFAYVFCVMRLYIVTKIRKVKKISTNNMFFFIYICISFAIMFIRRKTREVELSLSGQETSSENDLMMMGGGGVQNLVTIPDDTISGWRSR